MIATSQWKGKVRKLICPSSSTQSHSPTQWQWVEAAKLKALVDEAVALPFVSRLKTEIAVVVSDWYTNNSGKHKQDENTPVVIVQPQPVRRGAPAKTPAIPIHPSTHIHINISQLFKNIDFYCKIKKGSVSSSLPTNNATDATPALTLADYFSDDEADLNQLITLSGSNIMHESWNPSLTAATVGESLEYQWTYTSSLKAAPPHPEFWPPVLDVERVKLIRHHHSSSSTSLSQTNVLPVPLINK